MNIKKIQAFTLVELIVVITILAILGTIAFISLQGYSTQARDSTRISDISSIKTSLELFQLDAGKYPQPTTGVNITYSGGVVWNQGTFGKAAYINVTKLDKIPTDPQSDKEYTYSVTSTRSEYQLGGIIEGDVVSLNPSQPSLKLGKEQLQVQAGETKATAYISGNYNGLMTKSSSGTTCRVLSIPSIITNDTNITDLQQIITEQRFVYSGYNNLPSSFISSKFKYNGGFAFTTNNLISYSDTGSCTALTDKTSYVARVLLLKGLQDAYTGTILKNVGEIKNIVSLSINTSSPSNELVDYAGNFVNNVLGGDIVVGSGGGKSCNTTQPSNATVTVGTPISSNQTWQSLDSSNGCFFTCNAGYGSDGTGCVLSSSCTSSLTEYTLSNGQTWACQNLGATTVWNGSSTFICTSTTDCSNRPNWAGDLYQRGRNEPITFGSFITNTFTGTGMTGNVGNNNMYKGESNYGEWRQNEYGYTSANTTRWAGTNPRGPCSSGRHVPSIGEWQLACDNILGSTCTHGKAYDTLISTKLRLPSAGDRYGTSGVYEQSTNYWSSTPYYQYAYSLLFSTAGIYTDHFHYRSMGYSVRCLKN